jgi:hypothetical protein
MVAIMSDMNLLKTRIGNRLYSGIQASCMRKAEDTDKLTRTVALYLARDTGEDFILEAWVGPSPGRAIAADVKRITSIEDWEPILGPYLYTAMKTSKTRRIEEEGGIGPLRTKAVRLSSPDSDRHDIKVAVRISFEVGRKIWQECYR